MASESTSCNAEARGMVPLNASGNPAFDRAFKAFYESLPENDQMLFSPCPSATDLLDGLKKLSSIAKHKQKSSFLLRISKFAEALQPYLNVVDIMVQSHPQYACLVWGALRLIFQVISANAISKYFKTIL
jgi:hypothetical protein